MAVHPKKPYQLFHYSHEEEWKTFQKRSSIRWRITASTTTSMHLHPQPPDKITPKTRKYYNNLRAGTIRSYVLPRVCTQFTLYIRGSEGRTEKGPKSERRPPADLWIQIAAHCATQIPDKRVHSTGLPPTSIKYGLRPYPPPPFNGRLSLERFASDDIVLVSEQQLCRPLKGCSGPSSIEASLRRDEQTWKFEGQRARNGK